MANIKGLTIEFSADMTKLNDGLKKASSAVGKTQAELKKVDRALKFNPGNTTLLTQKFDLLKKAVTQTEDKLKNLKDQQAKMDKAGVDRTSEEYRQLERDIIKCENQLEAAQKDLKDFGSVGAQQAKAVGDAFKKAGDKMAGIGRNMTQKITAPIVAGFTLSASFASDLEENLNKIDVAFGDSAGAVKDWASNASKQFGLSKVQATGATSAFGALGKGIGLSEAESAEMATTLAGLSADLGSYFNMSVDDSAKALEGIFTGESEALKGFGVVMNDTNLQKFAEDQGLVWSEMSESEKTTLRYKYVLDKTKDAQGDFARTSDGTANSLKQFQASSQDLGSAIGTVLLPIITPIIQKITEWVQKFGELSPTAQKIITVIGIIVAAIGPLLVVIGSVISAIGTIMTFAPAIAGAIGPIIAPVLGVVAAVAAAVAIGIVLYKNWDKIKDKLLDIWENIKKAVKIVTLRMQKNFHVAVEAIKKAWDKVVGFFQQIWNGIKKVFFGVVGFYRSIFQGAWNAIKVIWSGVVAFFKAIWNGIKAVFSGVITYYKTLFTGAVTAIKMAFNGIKAFFTGIWNGIKSVFPNVKKWFGDKFNVLGTIKSKFKGWGEFFSGLWTKVKDKFKDIGSKIGSAMSGAIKGAMNKVINKVESAINKGIGFINSAIKLANKLPGVNVKTLGKVDLPSLATGGVLKKGQIGLLEGSGAEAVVPLEKNREWISKVANVFAKDIASMPTSAQVINDNSPITVNVYGSDGMSVTELASAVERRLIQSQKRRTNAWA